MLMCTVFANCYSKYYSKLKSSLTIYKEKNKRNGFSFNFLCFNSPYYQHGYLDVFSKTFMFTTFTSEQYCMGLTTARLVNLVT